MRKSKKIEADPVSQPEVMNPPVQKERETITLSPIEALAADLAVKRWQETYLRAQAAIAQADADRRSTVKAILAQRNVTSFGEWEIIRNEKGEPHQIIYEKA